MKINKKNLTHTYLIFSTDIQSELQLNFLVLKCKSKKNKQSGKIACFHRNNFIITRPQGLGSGNENLEIF